jgi:hypothetical protein
VDKYREALIEIQQAILDDTDQGVAWLSREAAREFKEKYRRLSDALCKHRGLVADELTF